MKTTHSLATALVMTSVVALSACQSATTSPSSSATSSSTASQTSTSEAVSSPAQSGTSTDAEAPASSGSSSAASDAQGPTGARPDSPQTVEAPAGAVITNAKVVMAGGFRSEPTSKYAKFYSVWKVDGSAPGKATIEYELLDASGAVLSTTEDTISIGKGSQMTKVSNAVGEAPAGAKTVRMKISEVEADPHGGDITISDVKITPDAYQGRWPQITGQFTAQKDAVYGISAVCYDGAGRVVIDNGGPAGGGDQSSGTFTINVDQAPSHWKPTNCFVGHSS